MKLIKITSGTYGFRTKGTAFVEPKTPASEPFTVSDDEDVPIHSHEDNLITESTLPYKQNKNVVPEVFAPSYSVDSKAQELRAIAKDAGITFPVGTSKTEMVKQLDKYFADPPDENENDEECELTLTPLDPTI